MRPTAAKSILASLGETRLATRLSAFNYAGYLVDLLSQASIQVSTELATGLFTGRSEFEVQGWGLDLVGCFYDLAIFSVGVLIIEALPPSPKLSRKLIRGVI